MHSPLCLLSTGPVFAGGCISLACRLFTWLKSLSFCTILDLFTTLWPFYSSTPSRPQIQTALESSPQNESCRATSQAHNPASPPHPLTEHTAFWSSPTSLGPVRIHLRALWNLNVCQKPNPLITWITWLNHPGLFSFLWNTVFSSSPTQ